ncbi:nucleotide sugar dehydrogenase [Actinomycetospora endophytica]|uniref:Nucleotide sugar dehydrogenase n=1 Tax=Actinomycetospora endophytica TaxID=2291215 RepID=A0ABS8PCE0_9PSEU|nr:nucleotide sugar dehydrogenase [Actinomycetospora endophytica]MCD2195932.1 nucleotide sugar dehydrogenase [Actinomycetospora endophytica]
MAAASLSLAINGRERLLSDDLVAFARPVGAARLGTVAVVGLGYVGLPTALAVQDATDRVIGVDVDPARLAAIAARDVDLDDDSARALELVLDAGRIDLTPDPAAIAEADVVIVCVPTPVQDDRTPDLRALRGACEAVVEHARPGQVVVLTSTTYVGTTRELLAEPLHARGLVPGTDVHVAFSPERIDPGNHDHRQRETPRVVGGITADCASAAAAVIAALTDSVFLVSSPEAAELTKLYENIFRAVSLALANEFADACGALGLDPIEVTLAAGTKPYGFLGAFPGPGVGGHCIPCDPHYLLWQLRGTGTAAPVVGAAMSAIEDRPHRVAERAGEMLAADGVDLAGARVVVAGVSYKAGVRDVRESPALPLIAALADRGAAVSYHDPLMPEIRLADGRVLRSEPDPGAGSWDLAIVQVVHPGVDHDWVRRCPRVLDATYRFGAPGTAREVV